MLKGSFCFHGGKSKQGIREGDTVCPLKFGIPHFGHQAMGTAFTFLLSHLCALISPFCFSSEAFVSRQWLTEMLSEICRLAIPNR